MSISAIKVVITGGEGDLARELMEQLSKSGMEVAAPGRAELDVSSLESVKDYFKQHEADLLICNAGIIRDQNLSHLTEKNWDEVMGVNLKGAIRCARAALNCMQGRGGGSVVFISSYSALHPPIGQTAYATAKSALLGLVHELSHEHGSNNIRINAVLPGFLETKMTSSVRKQRKEEIIDQHVLKRLNTCKQAARFICFLHQELIHTSGQVFQLDSRSPF